MRTISSLLSSGFRDYLPEDMIPRQRMFDTIRAVFENFGFVPLDTPGLEREEVLTGGDPDFKMQIFRARLRGGDENLALRFDLTVPLARVVARYPEIGRPFKRYQVGKVWRGEKAQAGRYREFVQFDADIVGSANPIADAEIVALMYETLQALGVENFLIRVNNRKILNGLASYAGFDQSLTTNILRSIDKLDKLEWEAVRGELMGDDISLGAKSVEAIKKFVELRAENPRATMDAVAELMSNSQVAAEGIDELRSITDHVEALSVPQDKWTIDLSVARGLGYYTGPVFETILTDLPGIGSIFSGGRYDDLVARFGSDTVPATGASVGVDRLFAALEQLGVIKKQRTVAKVIILNFDEASSLDCQRVGTELRRANIPTEVYMGKEATLKGQLSYAVKQDVPVVIIVGSNERERGVAQVKDMRQRRQMTVERSEVLDTVRRIVNTSV